MGDAGFIDDVVAAHERGWGVELYLQARSAGVSDADLTWATQDLRIGLSYYVEARKIGITNAELNECRSIDLGFVGYYEGRKYGASHEQYCEAYRALSSTSGAKRGPCRPATDSARIMRTYTNCLASGATHEEALDAHRQGLNLHEYAVARSSGFVLEQLNWSVHEQACCLVATALHPPADS
jgi:hypothetical protein